eukprot:scaffold63894_cov59-Phaeocystis_antarctica.AAC.2
MRPISPSLCQNPKPWEPFTSAPVTACMVHSFCSVTGAAHATRSYPTKSMVTPSTTSPVQIQEPWRWPRTLSSMRWTSTRPIRPSAVQNAARLSRGHRSVGTESDCQMEIARLRAIRKAWHGKAMRKSCDAQAVSCEGSAKAPVTGFIAMLAAVMLAAAASRSGHRSGSCSLRALEGRRLYLQPMHMHAPNRNQTVHGVGEGRTIRRPHTPPSARNASSGRFVGGAPAGARPLRGWLIPRVRSGPIRGPDGCPRVPAPVKVTCARTSSNRAAVCACMRRAIGVAPWGARSSSFSGYLRLSASSRLLLLMFSSVARPSACVRLPSRPPASRPLWRSGRGLGLCRLHFAAVARGRPRRPVSLWRLLRRPSLDGAILYVPPRVRVRRRGARRLRRAVTLSQL